MRQKEKRNKQGDDEYLPVPAKHGCDRPDAGHQPDAEDTQQRSVDGQRFGGQTLDDNVVPIKGDHAHGPDRGAAEYGATERVDLAHERPKDPGLVVTVDDLMRDDETPSDRH